MNIIHVGPYIECIRHKVTLSLDARFCPRCTIGADHRKHDKVAEFCYFCGTTLSIVQRNGYDWSPTADDVMDALADIDNANKLQALVDCYKPSKILCMPWKSGSWNCVHDFEENYGIICDMNGCNIDELQQKFIEEEVESLTILKNLFGEESVHVRWGVIVYDRKL